MKKIATFVLGLSSSVLVLAAQVSIEHIVDGSGTRQLFTSNGETYTLGAADGSEPVYLNQNLPGKDTSVNNGSELIYLGAHQSGEFSSGEITVNIDNLSGGTTGSVSLVLSAAVDTVWNFDIEAGVQLENIFIIAQGTQTLQLGSTLLTAFEDTFTYQNQFIDFSPVPGSTSVFRSQDSICGYALPDDLEACNTDIILGLTSQLITIGFETNEYEEDYLAELQQEFIGRSLLDSERQVTSFNGSFVVDQFNVEIDSVAVVPVPSAAWLFGSALVALYLRKTVS